MTDRRTKAKQEQRQKQIPCGNDRKKSKDKSGFFPFAALRVRMTNLGWDERQIPSGMTDRKAKAKDKSIGLDENVGQSCAAGNGANGHGLLWGAELEAVSRAGARDRLVAGGGGGDPGADGELRDAQARGDPGAD
jgi:hypothetical protein